MVKKKAARKVSGGNKKAKAVAGKGTNKKKRVKAQKMMTSEMKPEKETTAVIEKLLPADKTEKKKKKKKNKVKFKSMMLREEAISYFEAILAGIKRGSIQIRQGDESVELRPTPQLDVSVKAASRDQDERIVFEIKWRTASESDLTISTD